MQQDQMMDESINVFGEALETCSERPRTGFFRDGCCNTSAQDLGSHTVCVEVTKEFLLPLSRQRSLDADAAVRFPRPAARGPLVPLRGALARGVPPRDGAASLSEEHARACARDRAAHDAQGVGRGPDLSSRTRRSNGDFRGCSGGDDLLVTRPTAASPPWFLARGKLAEPSHVVTSFLDDI